MGRFLLISLLILLSACSRGPDETTLRADLNQRLEQAFGPDSISIAQFKRQGSSTDNQTTTENERRLIYFDAILKLDKARDFGSWDSPGIANLISLLGAGPRGIKGIASGGNQAGDLLKVHGSLIYQHEDNGWQLVAPQGYSQAQTGHTDSSDSDREQLINTISSSLKLGDDNDKQRQVISEEMNRSLNNIEGRISRMQQGYPLAGGPSSGQYSRFAKALSAIGKSHNINIHPLTTEGGIENLQMLRDGEVILALSQSDAAWQAYSGSGAFSRAGADAELRSLANLYPEPVHVLTTGQGPSSIAQLRGKRVNLGQLGSASRDTALAVLAAHGVQISDLEQATSLNLQEALDALRTGKIDALVQVIGLPADALRSAAERFKLRFIPLQTEAIAQLTQARAGTFAFTISANSYAQQAQSISTVAVSSMLISNASLSAPEAEQLVALIFQNRLGWAELGSAQGAQLSARHALNSYGIPLHDGVSQALLKR